MDKGTTCYLWEREKEERRDGNVLVQIGWGKMKEIGPVERVLVQGTTANAPCRGKEGEKAAESPGKRQAIQQAKETSAEGEQESQDGSKLLAANVPYPLQHAAATAPKRSPLPDSSCPSQFNSTLKFFCQGARPGLD